MSARLAPRYDVVIVGGGPAGATLAARLARDTCLSVAVFESEHFPRPHIGESFASPVVPCLQECGVLGTVLDSDCWVKKFGGYYSWDTRSPSAAFFRHRLWQADGVRRWSMHVNREELDTLLLEHAERCGAAVFQGTPVSQLESADGRPSVRLKTGEEVACGVLVDASGRANARAGSSRRGWLSSYRNVAIWAHYLGGRPAQSMDGEWNVFREPDLSPIGCFAFDDGWCWYIPVPQSANGRRVMTHSIGIVTDPKAIRRGDSDLTRPEVFLARLRSVPLLRGLIRDARPLYPHLCTATNYSMIAPEMCDYDRRWIAVGDSSFFVDPLFSSGVSFAMMQAAAAARLVEAAFDERMGDDDRRELWGDYQDLWRVAAWSFATNIDQWYAAIAHENPRSVYWSERASASAFEGRTTSFEWLLDTDLSGDLLHVMTKGTGRLGDLPSEGGLRRALREVAGMDPADHHVARLAEGVSMRPSWTLVSSAFGASDAAKPNVWAHGPYWSDPDAHAGEVAPLFSAPRRCHRIAGADGSAVKVLDDVAGATALLDGMRGSRCTFGHLRATLPPVQWRLLLRMLLAGLVTADRGHEARAGC